MRCFSLATAFSHGDFRFRLRQAGYSLYDLMVTSTVVGVLGVGAVSMNGLVQDTRMTTEVNELLTHLSLTRSEAIKRGSAATLCSSTTFAACQGSAEWHTGWIMFEDPNGNGRLEAGEPILRVKQAPAIKSLHLGARYPGNGHWITYEADGTTKQNGTFTFCDNRGFEKAKAVIFNNAGRPYVSSKTWEKKPLNCT